MGIQKTKGGSGEEIMFNRDSAQQNGALATSGHAHRQLVALVFLLPALLVLSLVGGRRVQAAQGPLPQVTQAASQAGHTAAQATQTAAANVPMAGLPFEIEADVIDYDPVAQILTAEGDVTLSRGGVVLRADRVEISLAQDSLTAKGRLLLVWQDREVRGQELYLDMATGKGRLRGASGTVTGITFKGEEVSFDGDAITIEKGYLSSCDLDMPHYRLSGTRITIYPGSRAVVKGGWLRMGDVPVLPVLGTAIRLDGEGFRVPVPRLYLGRDTGLGAAVDLSYYLGNRSWADVTVGYASEKGFEGALGVSTQLRGGTEVSARAEYTLDDELVASLDMSKAIGAGMGVRGKLSYSTVTGTTLRTEASKSVKLGEVLGLSKGLSGLTLSTSAEAALLAGVAPSEAYLAAAPAGVLAGGVSDAGPTTDAADGPIPGEERISGGRVQVGGSVNTGRVDIGRSGYVQGALGLSSAWYSVTGGPAEHRAVLSGSAEAGAEFLDGLGGSLGYSVVKVAGATPFAYDYIEPSERLWGEVRLRLGDLRISTKGTYDLMGQRYTGTTYGIAYRMHCLEALVTVDPARSYIGFDLKLAGF